jgi:glycosyltransferase involved in cell wall biosynthesis
MSSYSKKYTALHLVNQLSLVNYSISYLITNLTKYFYRNFNINSYILSNKKEKFFSKSTNVFLAKKNIFIFIKQIRFLIINKKIRYIHIHNIWNINFLLVIFFYRNNLVYFIHPHGMLLPEALNNKGILHYFKKIFLLRFIKFFIIRKNIIFLAVTNKEKKYINEFFKNNKIYLLGTFYFFNQKVKQQYKLKKHFVCLARINPHKRILDLINSFYQANLKNDYKLFIYGERDDEGTYFYSCVKKIQELGLENKVFLKNAVYGKKKINILLSSWANILISHSEVISLSVVESGYCYLPSLVNKNILESNFPKKSVFVANFSIVDTAKKIKKVSNISLSERINMGRIINSYVCKTFTINMYAHKIISLYKNLNNKLYKNYN